MIAGGQRLRSVAAAAGLSYAHLWAIEAGREPLLDSDAVAVAELLGVPADWLRQGWRG